MEHSENLDGINESLHFDFGAKCETLIKLRFDVRSDSVKPLIDSIRNVCGQVREKRIKVIQDL